MPGIMQKTDQSLDPYKAQGQDKISVKMLIYCVFPLFA